MRKRTMTLLDIVNSDTPIFDFDYPFIAGYREEFEAKFIDYYLYREINFYSVEEFKNRLRSRLNLIMPLYLQLYKSEGLIDNPFNTYDIVECFHRDHDLDVFRKSLSEDKLGETQRVRDSKVEDIKTNQIDALKEEGDTDGTLKSNVVENVHTVTQRDQKNDDTLDKTTDSTKNVNHDETGTKNTDTTMEQHKDYKEHTNGTKNTYFSDTPQINFVVGNGHTEGSPPNEIFISDSAYATTLTKETTVGDKTSDEDTTGKSHEKTDTTVKYDEHTTGKETGKQTEKHEQDEHTDTVSDINTDQTDTTHGEHNVKRDTTADFVSHSTGSGQAVTDREAYNVGEDTQKRIEKGEVRYSKNIEGRKMQSPSLLLTAFRKTFLNIDRQVIEECETLFLGVFNLSY